MSPTLLWSILACLGFQDIPHTEPRVLDPALRVERIAAEPEIVTPTGIAVDARGRVLVIESHTHFRPEGYQGPPADRIRAFEDTDGDGRFETVATVFEGTRFTMNLAVEPSGSLLVATRNEVFRLPIGDGGRRRGTRHTGPSGDPGQLPAQRPLRLRDRLRRLVHLRTR